MGKIEVADSFVKTSDESANLPEIAFQYLEFISKERRLSVYTSRNYRHSIILFYKWLSGINQNITFQNIKEVKLRKKQELRSMDLGMLLVKRTKTTEMIVIRIVYY